MIEKDSIINFEAYEFSRYVNEVPLRLNLTLITTKNHANEEALAKEIQNAYAEYIIEDKYEANKDNPLYISKFIKMVQEDGVYFGNTLDSIPEEITVKHGFRIAKAYKLTVNWDDGNL